MERGHDLLAILDVRLILSLLSAFAISQTSLLGYNMTVRGHRATICFPVTGQGHVDRSKMMMWIHKVELVQ